MEALLEGSERFNYNPGAGLYLDTTARAQVLRDWDDRAAQRARIRAAQEEAWADVAREKTIHETAMNLLHDLLRQLETKKA